MRAAIGLSALAVAACGGAEAIPGIAIRMDPSSAEIYASPFPNQDLLGEDGRLGLGRFPNPKGVAFIRVLKDILMTEVTGFGTSSGVFMAMTGPPSITPGEGVVGLDADADVFLTSFDGERIPLTVDYREDGGPHGAPYLLSALPVQGFPLRPKTDYVLGVRRSVVEGVPKAMRELVEGEEPEGMSHPAFVLHRRALEVLASAGIEGDDLAAIGAFTTGDPTEALFRARADILADGATPGPMRMTEQYPDYCVFHGTVSMPDYQSGEPPFDEEGSGRWIFQDGRLVLQRRAEANVWLTIPRRPSPDSGFPTVVFVRTGGGGDRPLIDRGTHATNHGPAIEPGSGPARELALAGWAGLSVDGPHGGLRNPAHADEQLLIFNFQNPVAMRDNIRQSALELVLVANLVDGLTASSTACPGAPAAARLDAGQLALFGHSMGATIAPLAAAVEPLYRTLILSGAGGSWIENVIHKKSPIEVKFVAELLLEYDGRALERHDPALSLLQWAGEAADPPIYGRFLLDRNVLMFQGIVDSYILPPIANALSLALRLDVAEPILESSIAPLLALAKAGPLPLPISGNAGALTRVLVQHAEDGIEDGHEVVFQTPTPKRQYRCFLESIPERTATVPPAGDGSCP